MVNKYLYMQSLVLILSLMLCSSFMLKLDLMDKEKSKDPWHNTRWKLISIEDSSGIEYFPQDTVYYLIFVHKKDNVKLKNIDPKRKYSSGEMFITTKVTNVNSPYWCKILAEYYIPDGSNEDIITKWNSFKVSERIDLYNPKLGSLLYDALNGKGRIEQKGDAASMLIESKRSGNKRSVVLKMTKITTLSKTIKD